MEYDAIYKDLQHQKFQTFNMCERSRQKIAKSRGKSGFGVMFTQGCYFALKQRFESQKGKEKIAERGPRSFT